MGLNSKGGNKKYLNIVGGKIALQLKEPTDKTVERTKKNGSKVHELLYESIDGEILGIDVRTHEEYGKFLEITISDGEEYLLSIPMSSRYGMGLLFRAPNIDFNKKVEICTFLNEEGRGVLYLKQGADKVYSYWTKEDMKSMPDLEKVMFKGETRWDDTERIKYLEEKVIPNLQKKIKDANPLADPVAAQPEPEPVDEFSTSDDDDGLPF